MRFNTKLNSLALVLLLVLACSFEAVLAVDQTMLNDQKVMGPQTSGTTVQQNADETMSVSSSSDHMVVDSSADEATPTVTDSKPVEQEQQAKANSILQAAEREYVDSSDNEVIAHAEPAQEATPAATPAAANKVEVDASVLDSTDSEIATEDQKDSSAEESVKSAKAAQAVEATETVETPMEEEQQATVADVVEESKEAEPEVQAEKDAFAEDLSLDQDTQGDINDDGLDLQDSDLDQGVVPHHGLHKKKKTTSKTAGDAGAAANNDANHGVWLTGKSTAADQGEPMSNSEDEEDEDVQYDDVNVDFDENEDNEDNEDNQEQQSQEEDSDVYDDQEQEYQYQDNEQDFNDVSDSQIMMDSEDQQQFYDDEEEQQSEQSEQSEQEQVEDSNVEIEDENVEDKEQSSSNFGQMLSDSDNNEPALPKDVQFLRDTLIASNSEEEKLSSSESNANRLKSYDTAMQYDGLRQELKVEVGDSDEANRNVNNMTPADVRKHLKKSIRQLHRQTGADAKQLKTKLEKLRKRIQGRMLANERDQQKTLKGVRVFVISARKIKQAIAQHKYKIEQKSGTFHKAHNKLANSMHVWKQWYQRQLASYRRRRNRLQQVVKHHRMFTKKCTQLGKTTSALCLTIYNRVKQLNGQISSMMKVLADKVARKRVRTTQVLHKIKKAVVKHQRARQQRIAHLVTGVNTLEAKLNRRKQHIKQAKTALEARTKQLAALNQQDRRVARAFRKTHAAMIKRRDNLLARAHKLLQELKEEESKTH